MSDTTTNQTGNSGNNSASKEKNMDTNQPKMTLIQAVKDLNKVQERIVELRIRMKKREGEIKYMQRRAELQVAVSFETDPVKKAEAEVALAKMPLTHTRTVEVLEAEATLDKERLHNNKARFSWLLNWVTENGKAEAWVVTWDGIPKDQEQIQTEQQ